MAHKYRVFAAMQGECPACLAPEYKMDPAGYFVRDKEGQIIPLRKREFKRAEAFRKEYKPVYDNTALANSSYTGAAPAVPIRHDVIRHPAKPNRILHTCLVCGYQESTLLAEDS